MDVSGGTPVVVNALCYDDLDAFVLGLVEAEAAGKRFVYRCAASFVKARGGIEDRPLLTRQDLGASSGAGLVVVGSWVERTNRQLAFLLREPDMVGVEFDAAVGAGGGTAAREAAIGGVATSARDALRGGRTAVIYTSREMLPDRGESFAEAGRRVMEGLCGVAQRLDVVPHFLVAKGGITSIEIARAGLGARRAEVLGQVAMGVPAWRLGAGAGWADLPYVVFPGNVGDELTLRDVVRMLEGKT
jgi:uncharacterized protein YgbK (DUF1537 family)